MGNSQDQCCSELAAAYFCMK